MVKKHQSFILFALGLLLGALFYGLASQLPFSAKTGYIKNSRNIAYWGGSSYIRGCPQLNNIRDTENIDIYCTITTEKQDHGVRYKIKSKLRITKSEDTKLNISVTSSIKNDTEHVTEADYCSNCSENIVFDISEEADISNISSALNNQILSILNQEEDRIEEAVEEAYDTHQRKEELEEKIANCEISKKSTTSYERKITPEEQVECRTNQLEDITNPRARTRFFHSTVKKDLWDLMGQEDPLERSFFLSDYMQELNNPGLFTHDYFSIRSAIDTMEKYSDLRRHIESLGDSYNQSIALNNIKANLPLYFYTNEQTTAGRQDRRFLESAWNKNFSRNPFPTYYSASRRSNSSRRSSTRGEGMSANQFRSIVNSPEFKKLYQ